MDFSPKESFTEPHWRCGAGPVAGGAGALLAGRSVLGLAVLLGPSPGGAGDSMGSQRCFVKRASQPGGWDSRLQQAGGGGDTEAYKLQYFPKRPSLPLALSQE